MKRHLARVYCSGLWLLPRAFRNRYGPEMAAIHECRLADLGLTEAVRLTVVELCDVTFIAIRLHLHPTAGFRPALVAAAIALAVVGVSVAERAGVSLSGAAPADSIDFSAEDPAGEFTLAIREGRPVAATIDRMPLPSSRLVHSGDSIRFLGPGGGVVLSVAFYPQRARIEWEARPHSCRGQAATCVRYQ